MRHLLLNAEPQTCFPSDRHAAIPDFNSPLAGGLHSLWLPSGLEPRMSENAFHLNGKSDATASEFLVAYMRRYTQYSAAPAALTPPAGNGGNIATPFGAAFGYSNEPSGLSVGGLGYVPIFAGGTNKTTSVCVWFRINRLNSTGLPTLIGNSYSSTWWLGLRTATGKYKAIFRNSSSPYGAFEWGSYSADFGKVICVTFLLPFDANKTASVYHNGVLAAQDTLPNQSSFSGNLDVRALSTSLSRLYVEIFGFASWTRALYQEEIRELVSGPTTLLAKRQRFWYAPLMAYRSAQITGNSSATAAGFRSMPRSAEVIGASSWAAAGFRGIARSAEIDGTARLVVYRIPPVAPERTVSIRSEVRLLSPAAESRTLVVRREQRRIEA